MLCEARMAMNSDEASRDARSFQTSAPHLVAQIVPAPHSLEIDSTIIRLISEGYIGDLVNVKLHVGTGSDFPDPDQPLHWRQNRDLSGNNIMTMGIWYEAMMRWFGPAKTVQALGQTDRQTSLGRGWATTFHDYSGPHRCDDGDGMRRDDDLHHDFGLGVHPRTRPVDPRYGRRHTSGTRGP